MGKYVVYRDTGGYYRWRYIATNGNIIADSGEGYVSKTDCLRGIQIMKQSSNDAVNDQS